MTLSWDKDLVALLNASRACPSIRQSLVRESLKLIQMQQASIGAVCETLNDAYDAKCADSWDDSLPLAGVPFSVKETIALAGHEVTAGSLRMPPWVCKNDAPVIKKLKDKGAVPVARTNLPELAMCYDSENLRYGRTNNPLNPDYSAGGSSGGEAALLASGATLFGIGSDIGGSIRYPAHCCGVVGFKPASAAVDKADTFPDLKGKFSDSFLAVGPLTRSVADARVIYEVISGRPVVTRSRHQPRLIKPADMPFRIGHSSIQLAWNTAENSLLSAHYKKQTKTGLDYSRLYQDYLKVIVAELAPLMRDALTDLEGQKLSATREIANQLLGRPQVHPYLFWPLLTMPLIKPGEKRLGQAKARITKAREQIRQLLGKDGILLLPTCGELAMAHGRASWRINRPWMQKAFVPLLMMNVLDLPAISVPARRFQDPLNQLMPGMMLAAAPGAEDLLFASARLVEKAFDLSVADRQTHDSLANL